MQEKKKIKITKMEYRDKKNKMKTWLKISIAIV